MVLQHGGTPEPGAAGRRCCSATREGRRRVPSIVGGSRVLVDLATTAELQYRAAPRPREARRRPYCLAARELSPTAPSVALQRSRRLPKLQCFNAASVVLLTGDRAATQQRWCFNAASIALLAGGRAATQQRWCFNAASMVLFAGDESFKAASMVPGQSCNRA